METNTNSSIDAAVVTIGLELEIVAEPRREGGRRSRSSTNNRTDNRTKHRWDRAVERLSGLLNDNVETGVVQNCHPLSTDAPFQLQKEAGLGTFVGLDPEPQEEAATLSEEDWEKEETGEVSEGDGPWVGMEINTPVFQGVQFLETPHGIPESLAQLLTALRGTRAEIKVGLNSRCGVHVHAGYLDGMTLQRAQRVTSLVLVLERTLLRPLCSPQLRANNKHCRPLDSTTRFAAEGERCESLEIVIPSVRSIMEKHFTPLMKRQAAKRATLQHVWRTTKEVWHALDLEDMEEKMRGVTGYRRSLAVHLRLPKVLPPDDMSDKFDGTAVTMEFRLLQATADPELLGAWVAIVRAIMQAAAHEEEDAYYQFFHSLFRDIIVAEAIPNTETWRLVLLRLGLDHHIPFWERMLATYDEGDLFPGTEDGIL